MKRPPLTAAQMETLLRLCQASDGGYAVPIRGKDINELMQRNLVHYDHVHAMYVVTEEGSKLIDAFKAISTVS